MLITLTIAGLVIGLYMASTEFAIALMLVLITPPILFILLIVAVIRLIRGILCV